MKTVLTWRDYLTLTAGYVLVLTVAFLAVTILHFRLLHPVIVLHALLFDMVIAILLTGLFLKVCRRFPFHPVLLTNACLLFLLIASLFSILGPTMCDRSLSVFLLVKIKDAQTQHQTMTTQDLVQLSNTEYIQGSRMVEKRLSEHKASGAIQINDNVVTLTPAGDFIAGVFEFFYWLLDIPKTF